MMMMPSIHAAGRNTLMMMRSMMMMMMMMPGIHAVGRSMKQFLAGGEGVRASQDGCR